MVERRGLFIVDPQVDFCPGGALAVPNGDQIVADIRKFVQENKRDYTVAFISRDWHINPGMHFASNDAFAPYAEPDYVDTWPDHCVAYTPGAMFHPNLGYVGIIRSYVINKGLYSPGYSALSDDAVIEMAGHFELAHPTAIMDSFKGIEVYDVVGIETNHCVKQTALDLAKRGLKVNCIIDLCAPLTPEAEQAAITEMVDAGVNIIHARLH